VKKHGTDLLSLIFGLIFAALVAWWAIDRVANVDTDGRWLLVGGLAVLGLVILVSTLGRRVAPAAPAAPAAPVEPAPASHDPVDEDTNDEDTNEDASESPTAVLGGDEWPSYDPEAPRDDDPETPRAGDLTAAVRRPDDPEPGLRP